MGAIQNIVGIEFRGIQDILRFYIRLLSIMPLFSGLVIGTGVLLRFLTIAVFVLTFKVFLSIVQPDSVASIVDIISNQLINREVQISDLLVAMVSSLLLLIILQFLLNKIYLAIYLSLRTKLTQWLLPRSLSTSEEMHLHICLDKFPIGFDGIIKSCEIIVFYMFLITGIFYLNLFAGLLVLISVPFIIALILIKGRKEVHVLKDLSDYRKKIVDSDDDFLPYFSLSQESHSFSRNNIIFSQFFGGVAIVAMMCVFLFWYSAEEGAQGAVGLTALMLVFGIRFAVVYAGELSRCLSRVLQQRVMVENIEKLPF